MVTRVSYYFLECPELSWLLNIGSLDEIANELRLSTF